MRKHKLFVALLVILVPPDTCMTGTHLIFDCTDAINDLLQNPNSSESTAMLEKALNGTTSIYYTADVPITSMFPERFLTIIKLLGGVGWTLGTERDHIKLSIRMQFDVNNLLDWKYVDRLPASLNVTYQNVTNMFKTTLVPVQLVVSFDSQKTCELPDLHMVDQILYVLNSQNFTAVGFEVGIEHNAGQIKCVIEGGPWLDLSTRMATMEFVAGYRFPESYQLFEEYINNYRKKVESSLEPTTLKRNYKVILRMNMQAAASNESDVRKDLNKLSANYSMLLSRFAYKWSSENYHDVIIKLSNETLSNYVLPVETFVPAIKDHVFPQLKTTCPTREELHAAAKGQFGTLYLKSSSPVRIWFRECLGGLATLAGSPRSGISKALFPQLIVNLKVWPDTRALTKQLPSKLDINPDVLVWLIIGSQHLNSQWENLTMFEKRQLVLGLQKVSKEKIGCEVSMELFDQEPFVVDRKRLQRNASEIAELIVNECQLAHFPQFHLIILQLDDLLRFDPQDVGYNGNNVEPFYVSHVQPQLHQIYLANQILSESFAATRLILKLELRPNRHHGSPLPGQLYCNNYDNDARKTYQQLEALVAWSYIHNISIIVEDVLNTDPADSPAWVFEIKGSITKVHDSIYVLRNYPTTMGYLDQHPCVSPPEQLIKSRIPMSQKAMGCRFNLSVAGEERRILTNREFQTQLQFIFSKFSKVEINGADIEQIIPKLELVSLSSIVPNKSQIFLDVPLNDKSAENHIQIISDLQNKLNRKEINVHFSIQLSGWETQYNKNVDLLKDLQKIVNFANTSRIGFGMVLKRCSAIRWYENGVLESKILSLAISHLTCEEPWGIPFTTPTPTKPHHNGDPIRTFSVPPFATYLDGLYATKLLFEKKFSGRRIYFRFKIPPYSREYYLRAVRVLNEHAELYNMTYFVIKAFEIEEPQTHEVVDNRSEWDNGWWRVSRGKDMSDVFNYVQLESDYLRQPTQRPKPISEERRKEGSLWLIVIPTSLLSVLLCILLASWKMSGARILTKEEERQFLNGTSNNSSGANDYLNMKYNPDLEIPKIRTNSNSCTIIGAGNFGTVYKALLRGRWVALKVPNEGCRKELFRTTLQEIKILCYLGTHENVLAFVGAFIKEIGRGVVQIATELCENGTFVGAFIKEIGRGVVQIATELCENGTLLGHLRGINRSLGGTKRAGCNYELVAPFDLERFCYEVAAGMDYLTFKQIIHGDLATRNVLLDETFTCKIGDFGLSRKLYEYEKYVKETQEPLPWRWLAPESLRQMEFSSKSDVWSYGVTLWEIYSLGDVPYPGLTWTVNFVDDLENGLRLQKPKYSPDATYGKLLECWNIDAGSRPTFSELAQCFQGFREKLYTTLNDD